MKIKSNTKFCHFTSTDNARDIMNSETFYLSKYDNMNDLAEAALHSDEKNKVFVLCFSNSESLNIPAYYLYGGIDGKGCRIQFTDAKISEIIQNNSLYYINKRLKPLKKEIPKTEYKVYCDWIYYISADGYCEHKKDGPKRYKSIDEALNELKTDNKHYFVKNPIWKYENEFRIVVVFNQDIEYDKIALKFHIKDSDKGVSISFGPETTENEYLALSKEFCEYGVSKNKKTTDYAISMNLVARNKRLLKGE